MATFVLESKSAALQITDNKVVFGTIEKGEITPHCMVGSLLSFVELAVLLLSREEIRDIAPHMYLPWMELVQSSKGVKLRKMIEEQAPVYREAFGSPDPLGKPTLIRAVEDNGEILEWGDVKLYKGAHEGLPEPKSAKSYTVLAPGPVSIQLALDLLGGFLYDIRLQSEANCAKYSLRFLRRWGQDAFEGVELLPGIPLILEKGVTLTEEEELDPFDFDTPSAEDSPSARDPFDFSGNAPTVDQGELKVLREKLKELEQLLVAARSENESLKRAVKKRPEPSLDAELSVSKAEIQALEDRIEDLERERSQLRNVITDAKGRHGTLESRNNKTQAQLERAQAELRDAAVEISKEHRRAEEFAAECQELRPLKKEVDTLEAKVRSLTKDIALLNEKANDGPLAEEALERLRLARVAVVNSQQTFCDIAALADDSKLRLRVKDLAGRNARSDKHRKRLAQLVS